jgi:hypothetical protein
MNNKMMVLNAIAKPKKKIKVVNFGLIYTMEVDGNTKMAQVYYPLHAPSMEIDETDKNLIRKFEVDFGKIFNP